MPAAFQWLHTISFFHAAFEALAVNELRYLQLHEEKYGVNIDVPAAAILSTFGLRAEVSCTPSSASTQRLLTIRALQSFWWPNIALLGIFFGTFTVLSFLVLHFYVKEKR